MSIKETKAKNMTFGKAIIPVLFLIAALFVGINIYGADPHIPILATAIVAAIVGMTSGYTWKEMEDAIVETIRVSMQAILILMIIGAVTGSWILSGTVPSMIYYGLQIISPGVFLVATTIICAIVSIATGSSWTTAGTVGIALIGIGEGLGIPLEIVAGAIISGAYFGDKLSPLSDSTNLAPAMAGSELVEHIRHMLYTTVPSFIIALILYGIIGMKYAGNSIDSQSIKIILEGISSQFTVSPVLLVPPLLVIFMVVFKIPAIPGLIGGTAVGAIFAVIFQGANIGAIIDSVHYGFVSETGVAAVDTLLSRGGIDSMMWTISLIICAMCFGGIMEKTKMLEEIARKILTLAHSTGSVVLSAVLTAIACNFVAGDQYLSIVITGRMYKDVFEEKGLHPKNLSRVLEDSGTLTSALVPWNTCGAFMYKTLGVHPFAYAPYAFLNLLNPLISIFYGYTGITMEKIKKSKEEKKEAKSEESVEQTA